MPEIDWDALRLAANDAMRRSYSPYSKFPVGPRRSCPTGAS